MSDSTPILTAASLALFVAYARDAGNWNGTPLVGGNVGRGSALRGNLTQLKRAGFVRTFDDDGAVWIQFTTAGITLAAQHGITL